MKGEIFRFSLLSKSIVSLTFPLFLFDSKAIEKLQSMDVKFSTLIGEIKRGNLQ
jgi:hypothetical protein